MASLTTLFIPRHSPKLAYMLEAWGVARLVSTVASPTQRIFIRQQPDAFVVTIEPPLEIAALAETPFWAPLPLITDTPPRESVIPIRLPADEWTRAHVRHPLGERPPPPDWRTVVFLADPRLAVVSAYNRLARMWERCRATWPDLLVALLSMYALPGTPVRSHSERLPCIGRRRTYRTSSLFFLYFDEDVPHVQREWNREYVRMLGFFSAAVPYAHPQRKGYTIVWFEPHYVEMRQHQRILETFSQHRVEIHLERIALIAKFRLARLCVCTAVPIQPRYTLHQTTHRVPQRGNVVLKEHRTYLVPSLPTSHDVAAQHMWAMLLGAHVALLKTGVPAHVMARYAQW